jgi:hypothetical protein
MMTTPIPQTNANVLVTAVPNATALMTETIPTVSTAATADPLVEEKLNILAQRIEALTDAVNSIGAMQQDMSNSVIQFFTAMQNNPMFGKLIGKFGGM